MVAQGATHEKDNFNLNGNDGMMPLNLVITWSIVVKKRGRIEKKYKKRWWLKMVFFLDFLIILFMNKLLECPNFSLLINCSPLPYW